MERALNTPFKSIGEMHAYFEEPKIQCLICGRRFGKLFFHLRSQHEMELDEYKRQFNLPVFRGLVGQETRENYRARFQERIIDTGLQGFGKPSMEDIRAARIPHNGGSNPEIDRMKGAAPKVFKCSPEHRVEVARAAAAKANLNREERSCEHCGKPFQALVRKNNSGKFCSKICLWRSKRRQAKANAAMDELVKQAQELKLGY